MGFGLMPAQTGSVLELTDADWLVSAIWMSLGTDRRAQQDDVIPNGSQDKRGWWGDTYRPRKIGSRLWLLYREKQLPETLRRAEEVFFDTPVVRTSGEIKADGDITDSGGSASMRGMREIYNSHDHAENDAGGPTDPPNQKMGA